MATTSREDYEAAETLLGAAEASLKQALDRLGGALKTQRGHRTPPDRLIRQSITQAIDATLDARGAVAEELDA